MTESEKLELELLRVPPRKLMRIISKMAKQYKYKYKNEYNFFDILIRIISKMSKHYKCENENCNCDIYCSSPDVLVAAYLSGKFPPKQLKLKVIHPKVANLIKRRIHYKVPKENFTVVEECNREAALMNLLYSKKEKFHIF